MVDVHLTHRALMYLAAVAVLAMAAVAIRRGARSRRLLARRGGPALPDPARGAQRLARRARGPGSRASGGRDAALGDRRLRGCRADAVPAARRGRAPAASPRRPRMSCEERAETAGPMAAEADVAPRRTGTVGPPRCRAARSGGGALALLRDYVALTKPRIISLLLLTTVAAMFVADPSGPPIATILWTMLGGYLAAGGAGAINHYLDRERDARMARTRAQAAGQRADRADPRARLRRRPGRARGRSSSPSPSTARGGAVAGRAARLRLRLHAVAEAADAAEHRHRRRRRRGAAAGRLGRRDRRARRSTRCGCSRSSSSGPRRTSGRWRC